MRLKKARNYPDLTAQFREKLETRREIYRERLKWLDGILGKQRAPWWSRIKYFFRGY